VTKIPICRCFSDQTNVFKAIEICSLDPAELDALAKKTTLVIATVGPYSLYGEQVFKACAENGTHYLDVTGEVPWVASMIKKYESTAKKSGSIMIPQIGIESAPADLLTFSLVKLLNENLGKEPGEIVVSLHEMRLVYSLSLLCRQLTRRSGVPSGGTSATILTLLETFNGSEIRSAHAPYALSPIPGPKVPSRKSWFATIFGPTSIPDLGTLTTSIAAMADTPIIQRSWGLLHYGPKFHFSAYMRVRNYFTGICVHFGLILGMVLLSLKPFRWLLSKYVYAPGTGATKEQTSKERIEYRAIGKSESWTKESGEKRAFVQARYEGSLYYLTGVLLAEAAMTILKDETKAKEFGGGIYTPATLGQPFIDRLNAAGFKFEGRMLQ
jgi:short subunit dehydrogenase-like uncharacterized protein